MKYSVLDISVCMSGQRLSYALLLWTIATPTAAINSADMTSKSPYSSVTSAYSEPQCEPVFLSSLSRHGSRTASAESKYLAPQEYMLEAAAADALTEEGKSVLAWSEELYQWVNDHRLAWGGLTGIGRQEHHSLGARTFDRFPNLFRRGQVQVDSTDVQRTQDSRDMFISGMVAQGANQSNFVINDPPSCDASENDSMLDYALLRFFDVCPAYLTYRDHSPLQTQYDMVAVKYATEPIEDIHSRLFDPQFVTTKTPEEQAAFVSGLYGYSCGTQVDSQLEYSKICSSINEGNGIALSYVSDLAEYIEKGPVNSYPIVTDMSCLLLDTMRSDIMKAGTSLNVPLNSMSAHLRFAHAETVIPVLSALGLLTEDPFLYVTGGDYTQREFNLHYQSPMATNVMLAVYDCKDESSLAVSKTRNKYFVQILHNEIVQPFPGCAGQDGADRELCPIDTALQLLAAKSCSADEFRTMCGGLTCKS